MTHFSDVIGHRTVVGLLDADLASPAQAYLFVGPSNVGKATVARRFAAALIGGNDREATRRAREGSHPDLVLVAPEGRTSITVDQARTVVASAVRAPLEADRKVFLLEEASMLNDQAANALLKTIEEPIASTTFILVAESEHDLPPTVASRCRTVVFGRVAELDIVAGLADAGVDSDSANSAANISGGRPGLAIALATEPSVSDFRAAWLGVPDKLTDHPGDAYKLVTAVVEATEPLLGAIKARQSDQIDARYATTDTIPKAVLDRQKRELARASDALYVTGLELLASFYRDTAAAQFGAPVLNADIPVSSLTHVTSKQAISNAQRVLDTVDSLRANQRPQLALAALFVDLGSDG